MTTPTTERGGAAWLEANSIPEPNTGCWLWLKAVSAGGYGVFGMGHALLRYSHRATWEATHGRAVPDGLVVRHRCHQPSCLNPRHLQIGTYADNSRDMAEAGRSTHGERGTNTRLSSAEVNQIRSRLAQGETQASIARAFGVTRANISAIATGRSRRKA